MLATGIIELCVSSYSSLIDISKKKDGCFHFCVAYWKLSSITEDTASPMPQIQDALKDLGDAEVFSTLDPRSGHWQVRMEKRAMKYTASATPTGGVFQFQVLPFGVTGDPGMFRFLMIQAVLVVFINIFCICYMML